MKIAVVFFLVAFCVGPIMGQTFIQWIGINFVRFICQVQTGVNNNLVQSVRNWNFTSEDPALKKYCLCVYKNLGLMDAQANIQVEKALTILPSQTDPTKFKAAVAACQMTGATAEETAYLRLRCYNIQYPKDIIAL